MSDYKLEEKPGYRGLTHGSVSFSIPDVYAGERKHAILKMVVPQATEAVCARPSRVCDIKVEYTDVETKKQVQVESSAKIQYVKPGKAEKKANSEVQKQLALIEAARIQKEAKEKAEKGDYNGARTILNDGTIWVTNNQFLDHGTGTALKNMFQNLFQSCENRYSYSTVGSKQFSSYTRGLTMGRMASADMESMNIGYCSSAMTNMVKSFEEDPPSGSLTTNTTGPLTLGTSTTGSDLIIDDSSENIKFLQNSLKNLNKKKG